MSLLYEKVATVSKPFCIIIFFLIPFFDSAQNFDWAKSMGGTNNDNGYSTKTDHLGNVYTTGFFEGSADFNPSSVVTTLISRGNYDVFIQKLNPFGNLVWAKSIGGPTFDCGYSIDVDENQNVYVAGSFRTGPADFDPGEDSLLIPSNGGDDIFIMKLDPNGNLVWVKTIGGGQSDAAYGMRVVDGFVYVTGYFSLTVDFDPGTGVYPLVSSGDKDAFVLKLDTSGNFNWAGKLGGTSSEEGYSVSAGSSGSVCVSGSFNGSADFDPGAGTAMITSIGGSDVFITKLDINGNLIWAKSFQGTGNDSGRALTLDSQENIFLSGYFHSTTDFNPGPGINNLTSSGFSDVYIAKLDPAGSYLWAKRIGSNFGDLCYGIDLDDSTNVYIAGTFKGIVDFDPGLGVQQFTSTPYYGNMTVSNDVFVLKLNQDGEYIFARTTGGQADDFATALSVSGRGDITVTGYYSDVADFDPWTTVYNLTAAGGNDVYLLKLTCDSRGIATVTACDSYTWLDGVTYTADNNVASVIIPNAAGCDSTVFLNLDIQHTNYRTDFVTACDSLIWLDGSTYTANNNTATYIIHYATGCDSIISLNLTILQSDTSTNTITACDSIVWMDGNVYYSDNSTATHILTNMNGCDSVVKLDLTILNSSGSTQTITSCDNYTWINGVTYFNSANDTYLLTNSVGCDSIITLNLTIGTTDTTIHQVTACDSFTWIDGITYTGNNNSAMMNFQNNNGCDSLVFLQLEINHPNSGVDSIFACNSYIWIDGVEYTTDNSTATFTLTNAGGCDSIVTLDLNLEYIDVSTSVNGITITSNQSGAIYQWINCSGNIPVAGATAQSFTPTSNGTYAVEVIKNGCTEMSDCVTISELGLESMEKNGWKIYPSPATTQLTIELTAPCDIEIVNMLGSTIALYSLGQGKNIVDIDQFAPGVYVIKTLNGKLERFVKNDN